MAHENKSVLYDCYLYKFVHRIYITTRNTHVLPIRFLAAAQKPILHKVASARTTHIGRMCRACIRRCLLSSLPCMFLLPSYPQSSRVLRKLSRLQFSPMLSVCCASSKREKRALEDTDDAMAVVYSQCCVQIILEVALLVVRLPVDETLHNDLSWVLVRGLQ